jgi:NADH-quinone oxidoreductase subunit N
MFPTQAFIDRLSGDLRRDLIAFLPELILCAAIVVMLLGRMFGALSRLHMSVLAFAAGAIALATAISMWPAPWTTIGSVPLTGRTFAFTGLLVFDTFGLYVRVFLLIFLCLSLWLSMLTGIPDREDSADYSTLLVGGTLGMMLMVTSNHLLMAFLAVEMASLPSYVLAGFLKGRRQGSEAALKYVVYGASASGVMLYGISLIAGTFGTGLLPEIARTISDQGGMPIQVVIGVICVIIGLGFKLSAVPFHFWCPDVFEGAAAEVGAFLSVASKSAALALSARFLFSISGTLINGQSELPGSALAILWALFAAVTATFGNFAALMQSNLKRLLAYSTIAHAGIMMMALVPVGPRAVGPLLYYISAYLLMNLGAFAVIALVRNQTGSEDISAYRGLIRRSPLLAIAMAFFLLSLLGLPPLAGFAAKFQVFAVIYDMGRSFGAADAVFAWVYFGLLIIAALNTAVSAGYYLKVLRAMMLEEPSEESPIRVSVGGRLLVCLLVALVVAAGILWDPLTRLTDRGARSFESTPLSVKENRS